MFFYVTEAMAFFLAYMNYFTLSQIQPDSQFHQSAHANVKIVEERLRFREQILPKSEHALTIADGPLTR